VLAGLTRLNRSLAIITLIKTWGVTACHHVVSRTCPRREIGILASLLLASLELLRLGGLDGASCTARRVGAARRGEAGFLWIASKKQSRRSSEQASKAGTAMSPPVGSSWSVEMLA
jgi:hypothetical protein